MSRKTGNNYSGPRWAFSQRQKPMGGGVSISGSSNGPTIIHRDGTPDETKPRASAKPKCACGNPVENRYGTCDECQDAAYNGDANGEW